MNAPIYSVTFITSADLGRFHNLKSDEANSIIKALKRLGNDVTVFCRSYSGNDSMIRPFISYGHILFKLITFVERLSNQIFNLREYSNCFIDRWMVFKCRPTSMALFLPYSFKLCCDKMNSLGAYTVNFGTSITASSAERIYKKERLFLRLSEKDRNLSKAGESSLNSCDHIITYSEYCKREYIKNGMKREKISVMPLGVDIKRFKPGKYNGKFRVLCVADFTLLKGLHYLLEAWKELNLKDAELIVVGYMDKDVRIIVDRYSDMHNLIFVDHSDPCKYYSKSSVFVFPSLTESFGKVVLEALASGLPVISSRCVGASEILTEGKDGFIVKERSVDALKEKILFFYNNRSELKKMSGNALRTAKQYSWKHFEDNLYKHLRDILLNEAYNP